MNTYRIGRFTFRTLSDAIAEALASTRAMIVVLPPTTRYRLRSAP